MEILVHIYKFEGVRSCTILVYSVSPPVGLIRQITYIKINKLLLL
jgi:hypothetical protein